MTARSQVEETLTAAGFTNAGSAIEVGGVTFTFDQVFVGPVGTPDLVVELSDPAPNPRKLESLGRALDYVGSKRSLTMVLTSPDVPLEIRDALAAVGRVVIASDSGASDALAVLLPLPLPSVAEGSVDAMYELKARLSKSEAVALDFFSRNVGSPDQVRERLREWIVSAVVEGGATK